MKRRFLRGCVTLCMLICSLLTAGCSDGLSDALTDGTLTTYTFYACTMESLSADGGSLSEDALALFPCATRTFAIGETIGANLFPTESDEAFAAYKRGYTIDGWLYYNNPRTDKNAPSEDIPATVTADTDRRVQTIVVTPQPAWFVVEHWSPISYTVRFDANGGAYTASDGTQQNAGEQGFSYDEAQPLTANPFARGGYVFIGWNTQPDGTGTAYEDAQTVTNLSDTDGAVITLYAQWRREYITVSFDANGGTGEMAALEQIAVDTTIPTNTFGRTGYDFVGWSTVADGAGFWYADGATITGDAWPNDDITLYAQWSPQQSTVLFDANDGSGATALQSLRYDLLPQPLQENQFVRTGYDFAGWNTVADGSGTAYATDYTFTPDQWQTEPLTLYAQWHAQSYTVSFDANGGTGAMTAQTISYPVPTELATGTFTRTGYTFIGWNTAADGSGEVYHADETLGEGARWISGDLTLYAQWELIRFTVTLSANDQSGRTVSQTYWYGEAQALAPLPFSRTGYDFIGWNTAADGSGTAYSDGESLTLTDGDRYLYAQWKAQVYRVSFAANGGTGTMTAQEFTYDEAQSLLPTGFTRAGWNFVGWSTSPAATTAQYTDTQVVSMTEDLTLYAVWKPRGVITTVSGIAVSYTSTGMTFAVGTSYASYTWHIDRVASGAENSLSVAYDAYADGAIHKVVAICYDADDIPHTMYLNFSVE